MAASYTRWFVIIIMLAIPLIFEGWCLWNGRPNDTISSAVWDLCTRRPWFKYSLPVIWGALGAHFFITTETWKLYVVGSTLGMLTFLKKSGDVHL